MTLPDPVNLNARTAAPKQRAFRIIVLIALLFGGVQLWLLTDFWLYRPLPRVLCYVAALAVCFVPAVQRIIGRLRIAMAERSWPRTLAAFAVIASLSIAALYATALSSQRQFTPVFHDEFAYLLQARMIAAGHLWMPAHPLGDFFDTFYVITDRAYAAQYFPGTAMLLVPAVWLHLPTAAIPLLLSGLACGFLYLLLRDLFDGTSAIAGVFVAIGVPGLRFVSIMSTAQMPALLLLVVTCWAMVRWDRARCNGWIALAGAAMGWFAITRPLDAAVVGFALCGFVAWRLRADGLRAGRRAAAAGALPLVPFLCIQLVLNHGVTGQWLESPFTYYAERDMPGTSLGFHTYDPARRPVSQLPQKQAFFDAQVAPAAQSHTPKQVWDRWLKERLKYAVTETLPDMLLIIVMPAGLWAIGRDERRWMVVAIAPLWWVAYSFHAFTFFHYYVVLVPSTLVVLFTGFEALGTFGRPAFRASRAMRLVLPVSISLLAMPQFKVDVRDQVVSNPVEGRLLQAIASEIKESRSVVLVRYAATAIAEQEVVYNIDNAWPDDARVIRAHDLGDRRNIELYRYYADRQPDRVVYRFDRGDLSLVRLGTVTDLAALDPTATKPTIGR